MTLLFAPDSKGGCCHTGVILDGLKIVREFSRKNRVFFGFNDGISFFQKFFNKMLAFGLEKIVSRLNDIVWDGEKKFFC